MNNNWIPCFGLDTQADKSPYKKAIITENSSLSYIELKELSCRLAYILQSKGLSPGDDILIYMPNSTETAVAFFASVRLRLNITLANILSQRSELETLIYTTHPRLAFVGDDGSYTLLHSCERTLDIMKLSGSTDTLPFHTAVRSCSFPCPRDGKTAYINICTSGSTGKPKVVSNSYLSERANANLYTERMLVTSRDVILTALPVTQRFGLAAMLGSCMNGATFVLARRFRAETMLSYISQYHVSVQYGVPTMFLKERAEYESTDDAPDISTLRTGVVAGSDCPEDIFRWFEEQAGCRLLNCYGTSEIGGLTMTSINDSAEIRYHTCGQPLPGATVKVADKAGRILPTGQSGEIICQVPWIMNGYIGEPALTSQMFDKNGYFLTGDIGKTDEEGHLTIIGRRTNMIVRGGYNIFPAEVEQALARLPGVLESCVMGYRHRLLGECILAFIKPAHSAPDATTIRELLGEHIARYKLPDCILYTEEIPKLPNGKFDYPSLRGFLKKTDFKDNSFVNIKQL